MLVPDLFTLYVDDTAPSAAFYERLLGRAPTASFPNYVAFSFDSGVTLSLWSKHAKDFVSGGSGHRSEVAFTVVDRAAVMAMHERWVADGVRIEQAPHEAAFGPTFVAVDPDGHRLRVCVADR
jgi:catechol 2,3-dioxygenase-like lactoylglutathione lyase family enzyme